MAPLFIKNTILINAPAADIWDVLTDPEKTKLYMFGCETVSLWRPGSSLEWEMIRDGEPYIAVKGTVVEFVPDKKLVYTVIDPNNLDIADIPENYLTVTYELNQGRDSTELIVTQGDYSTVAEGEKRYEDAFNNGEGWNPILEQIKTIAEEDYKVWLVKNPPQAKNAAQGKGERRDKNRGEGRNRERGREGRNREGNQRGPANQEGRQQNQRREGGQQGGNEQRKEGGGGQERRGNQQGQERRGNNERRGPNDRRNQQGGQQGGGQQGGGERRGNQQERRGGNERRNNRPNQERNNPRGPEQKEGPQERNEGSENKPVE